VIAAHDENRIPKVLLGTTLTLALASHVWCPFDNMLWHDWQRLVQTGLFLAVVPFISKAANTLRCSRLTSQTFVAALVLGAISGVLSPHAWWSFLEISIIVGSVALIACAQSLGPTNPKRRPLVVSTVLCGFLLLYALQVAISYLAAIATGKLSVPDLFQGFSNIRFSGHYFTIVFFPLIALTLCRKTIAKAYLKPTIAKHVVSLLPWFSCWVAALIIVNGTRGTWLALVFASCVGIFLFRGAATGLLRQAAATAFVGLLSSFVLFFVVPKVLNIDVTAFWQSTFSLERLSTPSGRIELWKVSAVQFVGSPILGIGPMGFAYLEGDLSKHPHGLLPQLFAEWGMISTIALCFAMASGIWYALRRGITMQNGTEKRSTVRNELMLSMGLACCAFVIQSMVDGIHVMPFSQIMICVIVSCIVSVRPTGMVTDGSSSFHSKLWYALRVFLLAIALTYPSAEAIRRYIYAAEEKAARVDSGHPRYWADGAISPNK
jgi:putative inorganic carbon (hco3(-)) transporter